MNYGEEFVVIIPSGLDPYTASTAKLGKLFQNAHPISRFNTAPAGGFIQDISQVPIDGLLNYKIDDDCMIEVNNTYLKSQIAIRNQVSDLISLQFVSTVKRSEFLGKRKNVHDLGPAIIVSAVSDMETTYRVPRTNVAIRSVVIYTTLSNLMERMGESKDDYPVWLQEVLDGDHRKPRQRVFFLEEVHRDLTWPCFNLPVTGVLLNHWITAKFYELLCVGLQVLKHNQILIGHDPDVQAYRQGEKIRRARTILNSEYAHPPSLPELARQLGMSETQLKNGFKSIIGTTVLQYCINNRVMAARLLLADSRHSISEIGDIVGYEDHSAFSRAFRRLSGCSPQEWRQAHGT
jgi:AraC-like DNA-binding protein